MKSKVNRQIQTSVESQRTSRFLVGHRRFIPDLLKPPMSAKSVNFESIDRAVFPSSSRSTRQSNQQHELNVSGAWYQAGKEKRRPLPTNRPVNKISLKCLAYETPTISLYFPNFKSTDKKQPNSILPISKHQRVIKEFNIKRQMAIENNNLQYKQWQNYYQQQKL